MSDSYPTDSPTRPETRRRNGSGGQGGAVYGLGMIGALVYYWHSAQTGPQRLAAVGKAVVWPAFVVHGLLEHLSDSPTEFAPNDVSQVD